MKSIASCTSTVGGLGKSKVCLLSADMLGVTNLLGEVGDDVSSVSIWISFPKVGAEGVGGSGIEGGGTGGGAEEGVGVAGSRP